MKVLTKDSDLVRIREIIARNRVCWEVYPKKLMLRGGVVRTVGFEHFPRLDRPQGVRQRMRDCAKATLKSAVAAIESCSAETSSRTSTAFPSTNGRAGRTAARRKESGTRSRCAWFALERSSNCRW